MGRAPCCDKANVKKGPWSPEEDDKLKSYIEKHGTGGNWIALPQKIGLKRCGKSCRLRWLNYLRPNIKHGGFSDEEDSIICSLYIAIGSRWSIIAAHLPGRTDNDIKNHWNTKLKTRILGKQRKNQHMHRRNATNSNQNKQHLMMKNKYDVEKHQSARITSSWIHANEGVSANINEVSWLNGNVTNGGSTHHVHVAPSLTIPQSNIDNIYDNVLSHDILEEGLFVGNYNINSLMKLEERLDLLHGMSSSFIHSEPTINWISENMVSYNNVASSYEGTMQIGGK